GGGRGEAGRWEAGACGHHTRCAPRRDRTTKTFVDIYEAVRIKAPPMPDTPRAHRPTDAELAILTELWRRGPSTVREIHEALYATRGTGYTTVLKLMQIMMDKGMLAREEDKRS